MDPKVQKNLADALEELEENLKPLQGLDTLNDNLSKVGDDLSATAKALEHSVKPFPEALEALKRASNLLSETATLLSNADPKVVADGLSKVDTSLKSLNSDLHKAIADQKQETDATLEVAIMYTKAIKETFPEISEQIGMVQEQLSGDLSANTEKVSKEVNILFKSLTSEIRRTKILSILSITVSLIVGGAIIWLLSPEGLISLIN